MTPSLESLEMISKATHTALPEMLVDRVFDADNSSRDAMSRLNEYLARQSPQDINFIYNVALNLFEYKAGKPVKRSKTRS